MQAAARRPHHAARQISDRTEVIASEQLIKVIAADLTIDIENPKSRWRPGRDANKRTWPSSPPGIDIAQVHSCGVVATFDMRMLGSWTFGATRKDWNTCLCVGERDSPVLAAITSMTSDCVVAFKKLHFSRSRILR